MTLSLPNWWERRGMQEREQGFIFLPQTKGDMSFQKKRRVRCIGCWEIASSSTEYWAGMKDRQEKKTAQEQPRNQSWQPGWLFDGLPEDNSLVEQPMHSRIPSSSRPAKHLPQNNTFVLVFLSSFPTWESLLPHCHSGNPSLTTLPTNLLFSSIMQNTWLLHALVTRKCRVELSSPIDFSFRGNVQPNSFLSFLLRTSTGMMVLMHQCKCHYQGNSPLNQTNDRKGSL